MRSIHGINELTRWLNSRHIQQLQELQEAQRSLGRALESTKGAQAGIRSMQNSSQDRPQRSEDQVRIRKQYGSGRAGSAALDDVDAMLAKPTVKDVQEELESARLQATEVVKEVASARIAEGDKHSSANAETMNRFGDSASQWQATARSGKGRVAKPKKTVDGYVDRTTRLSKLRSALASFGRWLMSLLPKKSKPSKDVSPRGGPSGR